MGAPGRALKSIPRYWYHSGMDNSVAPADIANGYFRRGAVALYGVAAALLVALFSPVFAERLLAFTQFAPSFVVVKLVGVLIVLGVVLLMFESDGTDDFLLILFCPAFFTVIVFVIVSAAASFIAPNNGWSYLGNTAALKNMEAQISRLGKDGKSHPDNQFLFTALSTTQASVREAAADKIDDLGLVEEDQFRRLLVCANIVGIAQHERVKQMNARGWAGEEDVEALKDWAANNPPSKTASPLQVEAWLRLAGEKELSLALSIPSGDASEDQS